MEDRDGIFDYIEEDSPRAAVVVDDRIRAQVTQLLQFPETGRPGRIEGTRELVISRTPYIAAIALQAIPCASCACCTARSYGPMKCWINHVRWVINHDRR